MDSEEGRLGARDQGLGSIRARGRAHRTGEDRPEAAKTGCSWPPAHPSDTLAGVLCSTLGWEIRVKVKYRL